MDNNIYNQYVLLNKLDRRDESAKHSHIVISSRSTLLLVTAGLIMYQKNVNYTIVPFYTF